MKYVWLWVLGVIRIELWGFLGHEAWGWENGSYDQGFLRSLSFQHHHTAGVLATVSFADGVLKSVGSVRSVVWSILDDFLVMSRMTCKWFLFLYKFFLNYLSVFLSQVLVFLYFGSGHVLQKVKELSFWPASYVACSPCRYVTCSP